MSDLTSERGKDYGHPLDHHGRVAAIWGILKESRTIDSATDVQTLWIVDKLVRFSHTFAHRDSLLDVSGYAECVIETWDEMERRQVSEAFCHEHGCYNLPTPSGFCKEHDTILRREAPDAS